MEPVLFKKPKCPRCGSANVYNRMKSKTNRCKVCGGIWPDSVGSPRVEDVNEQTKAV